MGVGEVILRFQTEKNARIKNYRISSARNVSLKREMYEHGDFNGSGLLGRNMVTNKT